MWACTIAAVHLEEHKVNLDYFYLVTPNTVIFAEHCSVGISAGCPTNAVPTAGQDALAEPKIESVVSVLRTL